LVHDRDYSENVAGEIDAEVRKIITENYERAKELLNKHKRKLINISNILIEKETLDSDEIDSLMAAPDDGEEIDLIKAAATPKDESTPKLIY
jgi:cell division protease FtsH